MYQTEKVKKFGGIKKLNNAIKTKLLDDVYCWENSKWYTQNYWNDVADKNLTGITLSELMTGTPLDATHFAGPLFNKMNEKGHVYEWVPQLKRWLYIERHPNAQIEPLNRVVFYFVNSIFAIATMSFIAKLQGASTPKALGKNSISPLSNL